MEFKARVALVAMLSRVIALSLEYCDLLAGEVSPNLNIQRFQGFVLTCQTRSDSADVDSRADWLGSD